MWNDEGIRIGASAVFEGWNCAPKVSRRRYSPLNPDTFRFRAAAVFSERRPLAVIAGRIRSRSGRFRRPPSTVRISNRTPVGIGRTVPSANTYSGDFRRRVLRRSACLPAVRVRSVSCGPFFDRSSLNNRIRRGWISIKIVINFIPSHLRDIPIEKSGLAYN